MKGYCENMYREIQYGAWHVVFREDLAEEVTSERIKFKKQLTNKEKGENIKTFIQSEFDIFKNRKKKKKKLVCLELEEKNHRNVNFALQCISVWLLSPVLSWNCSSQGQQCPSSCEIQWMLFILLTTWTLSNTYPPIM